MEAQGSSKKRRHNDEDDEEQGKKAKVENKDDPNRYTIGWVCALPKEQTAARAMLDEEFRDVYVRKANNDTNTYTLGSIGRHNIVIACLPKGQIGVFRASKVATTMTSTFRNIKFVLMVGIGGGVPSGPNDVRLGDVVVSTPTGKYPGVVQWDFGKTKDGKFERTGSLNNPPTFLLTALSKMESDHEMEGSKIQQNLDIMFKKWPRLKAKYARSDKLEDFVFSASYNHLDHPLNPSPTPTTGEIQGSLPGGTDCLYCDSSKAKKREVGEPVVHYGLIASGNQVIKDAAYRDEINKNLDCNALCIEMEAAGLMADFPCLVVRGICDYADSHKNKAWQEHAAAVAAALTKELLENVPPVEVDSERTVLEKLAQELHNNLADIHSTALATKSELAELGAQAKQNKDETVLQWLTPIEYGLQQSDFLRRKQPETGEWFLASDEYLAWINPKSNHQTLFCPGIPGAGKTILMSAVVDDIGKRFSNTAGVGIAYLYCSFQRKREQTLECLLSSLVKQLARGLARLPNSVAELHKRNKRKGVAPSANELLDVLCSMSRSFSTLFVLIDALDECEAESRFALLSKLFELQGNTSTTLKLFATSRFVPEIEGTFSTALNREIRAANEDICRYIRHRLPQIPMDITHLEDKITNEVLAVVDGMFLLAQLYLESLKDTTSVREILSALERFKHKSSHHSGDKYELSHVYDQAYEEAMERIRGQTPNRRELGTKVISWIAHATRPLTAQELQHALAVGKDHDKLDEENIRDVQILLSVCAGLVTIEEESGIIRLVHHTTQEYFDRVREMYFPGDHIMISGICVRYIWIVCRSGDGHSISWDDESSFPLLSYASYGWGYHAARGDSLCEDVERLLLYPDDNDDDYGNDPVDIWRILSSYVSQSASSPRRFPVSATGWAAYHGINNAVHLFQRHSIMINAPDSSETPPMVYAVEEEKADFVKLLFKAGANLSHHSQNELLHSAARSGSTSVLEVLIDHGANIEREDTNRRTPLVTAVVANRPLAAKLLVQKGASVQLRGKGDRTSLHEASEFNRFEMAKTLIENGACVDAQDEKGQTPLGIAARSSNKDLAMLLLDKGALITTGSELGKAALQMAPREWMAQILIARAPSTSHVNDNPEVQLYHACSNGQTHIVRRLVAYGPHDGFFQGYQLEVALLIAVRYKRNAIVNLLVEKSATILHISATQQRFALLCAIETECRQAAMQLIQLDIGFSFENDTLKPQKHKFALAIALQQGYTDIARALIEKGASMNGVQGSQGQTALCIALDHGYPEIAKLLIERGPEVNGSQEPHGTTPLFRAVSDHYLDIVELLLERGADVNGPQGPHRQTVLLHAINNSYSDITKLLVTNGARVNSTQGPDEITPLIAAIHRHDYSIAKLLIDNGAQVNGIQGPHNATPLSSAATHDCYDIIELLVLEGADDHSALLPEANVLAALDHVTARTPYDIVKLILEKGARHGRLTLALLEVPGNFELMLKTSALSNHNIKNFPAASEISKPGFLRVLVERNLERDTASFTMSKWKNCALLSSTCTWKGNSRWKLPGFPGMSDSLSQKSYIERFENLRSGMAKLLIDSGADVGARDEKGRTALFGAYRATAEVLLANGADVNAVSHDGQTALFECDNEAAVLLIDSEINVEARDLVGKTALLDACSKNLPTFLGRDWNFNKIKLLIERGADINATDSTQMNALGHMCMRHLHSNTARATVGIKYLIENGAKLPVDKQAAGELLETWREKIEENSANTEKARMWWLLLPMSARYETFWQRLQNIEGRSLILI